MSYESIFWIGFVHVMALAAIPFFTWRAFALCLILLFTISPLGVNLTYHRLLSHRGFKLPKWLEYPLATLGSFAGGGPVMLWVAAHRIHHRYSDTEKDPHNSRLGFYYSHMGHFFYHNEELADQSRWIKYCPDLASQKYYHFLNRYGLWITFAAIPLLYLAGGLPFVMWGGFVRVVLMLHITWFVNSATHRFGYRNYETRDHSTNCWWVALLAAGEGWHNNHHAQASSAAHGHKWWELDLTWMIIRSLEFLGLATEVKRPRMQGAPADLFEEQEAVPVSASFSD